jgi:hypothetical protein
LITVHDADAESILIIKSQHGVGYFRGMTLILS